MDTFALGLMKAAAIIEDGRVDEFVKNKYASYNSEIGKKIVSGEATLEELSDYALAKGNVEGVMSGRQEQLESIINTVMFG
jgi:xylose isomerase